MYTQEGLATDSTYEGWVAWCDGQAVLDPAGRLLGYDRTTPLFESVAHNAGLAQAIHPSLERLPRAEGRQTIDWNALPHERVRLLELYAFRDVYREGGAYGCGQPIISILAQPDRDLRWIQYKKGALLLPSTLVRRRESGETVGQARTGIQAWVVGYWDRTVGQAELWEIPARGGKWPPKLEFEGMNHPCWPRPFGFGLAPHVVGLTADQVPPPPLLDAVPTVPA